MASRDQGRIETEHALRLYRLLAALIDMSVSLIRFRQQAEGFAWNRLRG